MDAPPITTVFPGLNPWAVVVLTVASPVILSYSNPELKDNKTGTKKSTNKSAFNQSIYQKVYRDFAFVVDSNVDGNDIVLSALKIDQNLIKSVDIFDIFTDPSLGKDKKSLAIKVTMQAQDRTLSENDIQDLCSKIISTIEKETSGTVRS